MRLKGWTKGILEPYDTISYGKEFARYMCYGSKGGRLSEVLNFRVPNLLRYCSFLSSGPRIHPRKVIYVSDDDVCPKAQVCLDYDTTDITTDVEHGVRVKQSLVNKAYLELAEAVSSYTDKCSSVMKAFDLKNLVDLNDVEKSSFGTCFGEFWNLRVALERRHLWADGENKVLLRVYTDHKELGEDRSTFERALTFKDDVPDKRLRKYFRKTVEELLKVQKCIDTFNDTLHEKILKIGGTYK